MARKDLPVDMAAGSSSFPSSSSFLLRRAKSEAAEHRQEAYGQISVKYWPPIYAYFLRKYKDLDRAHDFTQGFFAEIVLPGGLMRRFDFSKRTQFRRYLLKAAKIYAFAAIRAEASQKRKPPGVQVSLESAEMARHITVSTSMTADEAYEYKWAQTLVLDAVEATKRKLAKDDKQASFEAFYARVIEPLLGGVKPTPISELQQRLGIAKPNEVSVMANRAKEVFAKCLRASIREYVDADKEVDEEITDLMRILSKYRATSGLSAHITSGKRKADHTGASDHGQEEPEAAD